MKPRVLVSTQMMIHDQERFARWLEAEGLAVDFVMNHQFLSEADCLQIQPIYDGWIAGDDHITARVLEHFKRKLKVISKWGTGVDSIDREYAETQGIQIKNSPGAFADAVGEMAVGYVLALTRGIVDTDRAVRENRWPKRQFRTLFGMNVGLIGMGAIGQGVAVRLKALGCAVMYTDPLVVEGRYQRVEIDDLFRTSDTVVVTCDLNQTTYHLVNKRLLELARSGLLLVNVSRGPVVCEKDLIEAIRSGRLAGAALDVFEIEPLQVDSQLRALPGIILGSHNANNTFEAVECVHENTISQLIDALR